MATHLSFNLLLCMAWMLYAPTYSMCLDDLGLSDDTQIAARLEEVACQGDIGKLKELLTATLPSTHEYPAHNLPESPSLLTIAAQASLPHIVALLVQHGEPVTRLVIQAALHQEELEDGMSNKQEYITTLQVLLYWAQYTTLGFVDELLEYWLDDYEECKGIPDASASPIVLLEDEMHQLIHHYKSGILIPWPQAAGPIPSRDFSPTRSRDEYPLR